MIRHASARVRRTGPSADSIALYRAPTAKLASLIGGLGPCRGPTAARAVAAATAVLFTVLSVAGAGTACVEITPVQNVVASDPGSDDEFGTSVALSGDTLVVGSPLEEGSSGGDRGAVYVYLRTGGTWSLQAKLLAGDPLSGAKFGYSVAILNNTVLVGAPGALSVTGVVGGAAYIFSRSGTTWTQTIKLVPADISVSDGFGYSVALSSIGTRDVALIGSYLDDNTGPGGTTGGVNAGSAYVFTRNTIVVGSVWTEVEKVMPTDGAAADFFGQAVALAGSTAIVGAPGNVNGAFANAGAAYAFTGNSTGSTWTQQAKLVSAEPGPNDSFGMSVAYVSNTAVIGAPLRSSAGVARGVAYVFARVSGVWGQTAALYPSSAVISPYFGRSVAISGDWIVTGEANPGSGEGKAVLHARGTGDWSTNMTIPTPGSAADEQVGWFVAILGSTVAVGSSVDNIPGFFNAGSVYTSDVAALAPASFIQHPADSAICASGSATLNVMVDGSGPVSVGWEYETAVSDVYATIAADGTIAGVGTVSGVGTQSLTVSSPLFSGGKRFRSIASNSCGSVTSDAATLTVCSADFDCSGSVSVNDLFAFLGAWFAQNGNPPPAPPAASADFDNSGTVSVNDLFAFLAAWFAQNGVCGP